MKLRVALVVVSCLLSIATGLVLGRPERAARDGGRRAPLIGLSMDTLKEERWQRDRDYFVERAAQLGAEVLVQAANSDDTRQIQDVEALLSRGVDSLVVIAHNGQAMTKAVDLAHEAGVPVIAYDRLIPDADEDLYISFDAVTIGKEQGRFLVSKLKGKRPARVVRIFGAKTDNNSHLVKKGQDAALAPAIARGDIAIIHEDWADNWKPEAAKKIVQAAITRFGPGLDAVLASNDGTAGGAIQALSEEGLAGKIVVTGLDAELAACQRIVGGTQSMTIYGSIHKLAAKAAESAVRMAQRRAVIAPGELPGARGPIPAVMLDVTVVTAENMAATVLKDKLHSYDDVYRGIPADRRPSRGF